MPSCPDHTVAVEHIYTSAKAMQWTEIFSIKAKESIDAIVAFLSHYGISTDVIRNTDNFILFKTTMGEGVLIDLIEGCSKFYYTLSPNGVKLLETMFGGT